MTTDNVNCEFKVFNVDGIDDYFPKWCLGIAIFVVIGLVAIYKDQFDRIIFMVVWSGLWGVLVAGAYYVLITADVLVNDTQIARGFRGRISQRIDWRVISLIREYAAYSSAEKEMRRFVQIFPEKSSVWKFQSSGPILFSDKVESFDELIGILNEHISMHLIKVEVKVNGVWERRQRLLTSL